MMTSDSGSGGQDFDLNLAPIIDCLTVLITFMLATATFLSIGVLDAGIAAAGATTSDATPPPVQITVELQPNQALSIKLSGKANQTIKLPAKDGNWDYASMTRELAGIKSRWKGVNAATLNADNSIEYRHVVKTMEEVRKEIPAVLLGGF